MEKLGSSLTTTREYFDEKNRVKSISTTGLGGPVQALSYDYDVKLNLTRRTDALQQGKSEYFKYDTLDRLRCASFGSMRPRCFSMFAFFASKGACTLNIQ